ncbi:asparagine synthase (glutamine-hydrolysing) [Myxococcaceae bacterium]|jgi:asparagine synthase (glutamine-hydrolysing)|nr:asparagine synthase (glutamine-hydrolysing) [Myxococcaceae bacterium]
MCGFCGVIGSVEDVVADEIAAMSKTLAHRGPDDSGIWCARFGRNGDGAVGFGHRRLSIIDLSPLGHQPMSTPDGALTVAFNGEIYNFQDLRCELQAEGVSFASHCDTEVILQGFARWGAGSFARLNGMFAFALWDARSEELHLVRDPIGIKPLYYQPIDGGLLFGSELRALRAHERFDPAIDRGALGRYLRHGYVCGPETIYRNARRLQPGSRLRWKSGAFTLHEYSRPSDERIEIPASFDEAVDRLDVLLGDAVERQMISDVPLGAFLSGGIDSSTVVSLMQERARGRVRTFSIGFEDERWNEAEHARAVADHLGTDHTELVVSADDARRVAYELPDLYDEPFADSSAIPTVLLSRLTRKFVKVALSGDGGDELFGGYPQHRRFHQLLPWKRLPLALRRGIGSVMSRFPDGAARNAARHLATGDEVEIAASLESLFGSEVLETTCGPGAGRLAEPFVEAFRRASATHGTRRIMHADARLYLPDDILTKVDRASMSVALEARVPILDTRVVAFGLALPLEMIWRDGLAKAPLRAVAYRRIPRSLLDRPKHGFGIPIHSLLADELRQWEAQHLDHRRLHEDGLLDPAGVDVMRRESMRWRDPSLRASLLWRLLCFQRWYAWNHRGERDG